MRNYALAFLLSLVVICFALGAQAAPPPAGSTGVPIAAVIVPDEGVTLYDQPMEKAKAVATLAKGTDVTVETLGLYWSEVTDGTHKGYVPTTALQMSDWDTPDEKGAGKEGGTRFAVFNHGTIPGASWTMTLREKPSRKAAKMGTYVCGTVMVALEKDKEYSLVHIGDKVGYLLTKYLTFYDSAQTAQQYAVIKNDEKVTFRNDRSLAGNHIITYLEPGTAVTLILNKKGWACIEAMGYQGFVYTEFLDILE
jgi:SH3-like domain-containing protein